MLASEKLTQDFETAHDDGEGLIQQFFTDRMFSHTTPFDAVVHRNSRYNFSNPPSSKEQHATVVKMAAMENTAMAAIITLAESCEDRLDLVHVMEHRVTDECLSIFNINGSMRKGQKCKLVEKLNLQELPAIPHYIALVDMGFIWRLATPSSEDREKHDETLFTWGNYAQKMFAIICARHPNASTIVLVNDPYDIPIDIKDNEHERRANGASFLSRTANIYMKTDGKLPLHQEFSNMFNNPQNKIRLQAFLCNEFKNMVRQKPDVKFIYSVRNMCLDLSSDGGNERLEEFECQQTEADTILLYIYSQLRKSGIMDTVVLDAEDTDVVVLSAYVAHKLNGVLGIKSSRQNKYIYDCKQLCTEEEYQSVIPLHIFTGSDAATAFFGHGKRTVCESVMKSAEARTQLESLGTSLPVSQITIDNMVHFTIKYVYRDKVSNSLGEARSSKWRKMKRKSTLRIPPDLDSLCQKIQRANYQVNLLHNYDVSDAPLSPLGHGWRLVNGRCQPIRYTKPALPASLTKIVTEGYATGDLDNAEDTDPDYSDTDSENNEDNPYLDSYE